MQRVGPPRDDELRRLLSAFGNRAIARAVAGRRVLARKPTESQVLAVMSAQSLEDLRDRQEVVNLLAQAAAAGFEYLTMTPQQQDSEAALGPLAAIRQYADAAERALIRLREELGDTTSSSALAGARQACNRLLLAATREHATLGRRIAGERYTQTIEPETLRALERDQAKYLMITPRPGTAQAEGGGAQYPPSVPVEKQYTLALPPTSREQGPFIKVNPSGKAWPVLDVLVVAGSHGGVGALFEQSGPGAPIAFSRTYWRDQVVKVLVQRGVRARYVVLDACLTASLVDVFAPLVIPGGRVIASMYSVNARFMTPELWTRVIAEAQGGKGSSERIAEAIEQRFQELKAKAPEFGAEGLVNMIMSTAPGDLKQLVEAVPEAYPLISRLRHLPKIHDAVEPFLRSGDMKPSLDALSRIWETEPKPDTEEATLLGLLFDAVLRNDAAGAAELLRAHYQRLENTSETDLAKLRDGARAAAQAKAATSPAAQVPTHLAAYDPKTNELTYDALFDDRAATERIIASTGAETRRETQQLRAAIGNMAAVRPVPVPAANLRLRPPAAAPEPRTRHRRAKSMSDLRSHMPA